jgi:hypothetical protein
VNCAVRVVERTRGVQVEPRLSGPLCGGVSQPRVQHGRRDAGGIVIGLGHPGERIHEDQRRDPPGVGARGQQGDRTASVATDHRGPLGADRVEHGDEIVGGLLEERFPGRPSRIGETGAAPIEDEHAAERRQSLDEARQRPEIPHGLDVAEPSGKEHDVDRAVTDDLIGHVLVADACVSNVGPQHDPQYARRSFGAPSASAPGRASPRSVGDRGITPPWVMPGWGQR